MALLLALIILLVEVTHWAAGFLIVTDPFMNRMVSFNGPGHNCVVTENRTAIMEAVLTSTTTHTVRAASDTEMDRLMDACKKHMARPTPGGVGGFIYPGTKWCGPGDVARTYEDLGDMVEEDRCCRDHDNCPLSLAAGQCKGNVCNKSPFTRSECKCDIQFQHCLQRIHSATADTIGALYFNIARVMCFNDPAKCEEDPASCQVRIMPMYRSDDLRAIKNLLNEVFRGIVRAKLAFKARLLNQLFSTRRSSRFLKSPRIG